MKRKQSSIGRIEVNPEILGGKPIFAGTRISVELVLDFLAHDWNPQKILAEYPTLAKPDIQAAISYAAKRVKGEEIHILPTKDQRGKEPYLAV